MANDTNNAASAGVGFQSYDEIVENAWESTLADMAGKTNLVDWRECYINNINSEILMDNSIVAKGFKNRRHNFLTESQVAQIMNEVFIIRNVHMVDDDEDMKYKSKDTYATAIYDEDEGIYYTLDEAFTQPVRILRNGATTKFIAGVIEQLSSIVPMVEKESNKDLIPFRNGILDYKTKQLIPFSPDHVFLWKVKCNWNPNATNPQFDYEDGSGTWDYDSWMSEIMSGVDEDVKLMHQIIGSIVRPLVDWQTAIWLYSRKGSSGKGTLLEMMRKLVPSVSCNLKEMGEEYKLTELMTKQAVGVFADENPVGTYVDKSDAYKSLADGSYLQLNRKYRDPITISPKVRIVQCLNELPKFQDKSFSMMRRNRCVEMKHHYSESEKKREIKTDFLKRQEVLEYAMKKSLLDIEDYYTIMETQNTRDTADEIMQNNNPVQQFVDDVLMTCPYEHLPYFMVYELYKPWFMDNVPNGKIVQSSGFVTALEDALQNNSTWESKRKGSIRISESYQKELTRKDWKVAVEKYNVRCFTEVMYASSKDPEKKYMKCFDKAMYTGGVFKKKGA